MKHLDENEFKKLAQFGFQKMGNFTNDDVFIVGYPKSGNTLLQHIIAHLVFGLEKDAPKSLINSCVTEYYNNPWFFRHNQRHFFKSHELPKKEFKKVIYIVRDGRAAIRSYYYMLQNMGEKASLQKLYESGGKSFVGSWASHVEAWLENPFNADIHWLKYEDIIQNKEDVIKSICQYLEIERTSSQLKNVVEATSLANMKAMENDFSWQRSKSFKTWSNEGSFVREGKAKGFNKDETIKEEWIKSFEIVASAMLKEFKYLK